MPETIPIPIADLLIDAENPRLPQPNVGQREALRAIAEHQGRKLQVLARDILSHGLNPTDLPIVMPFRDDVKRYVVLEGNRRLAALKSLENPEFLVDAVSPGVLKEIRRLSKEYQTAPIDSVQCVVVKDKEEARHWIELRHTGENGGAGIVPWGSDDAARYRARTVGLGIHSQALNFLEQRGDLTPEARRTIPATSFKRLIESPAVREKLGIEIHDRKLYLLADANRVAKALLYIVHDLTRPKGTKVKDIYTREQRVEYAEKLPKDILVTPTLKNGQGVDVNTGSAQVKVSRSSVAKIARRRDRLVPRDCILHVTDSRLRAIESELRRLSLDAYPNAVGVLFRVFVELSVDAYLQAWNLPQLQDPTLRAKLQQVTNDLVAKKKLTAAQAVPVRRACSKDSFLAPSITLMHQYVHNQAVFPAPGDLRAHWDSLQPFVVAMWAP